MQPLIPNPGDRRHWSSCFSRNCCVVVGCLAPVSPCRFDQWQCPDTIDHCINRTQICDHVNDCPNGEDESPLCSQHYFLSSLHFCCYVILVLGTLRKSNVQNKPFFSIFLSSSSAFRFVTLFLYFYHFACHSISSLKCVNGPQLLQQPGENGMWCR